MLSRDGFETEYRKMVDRSDPDFIGDFNTASEAIAALKKQWEAALKALFSGVVPPCPPSFLDLAGQAADGAFGQMQTIAQIQAALAAYAGQVAAGITSLGVFTASPPSQPYDPTGCAMADKDQAISCQSAKILAWAVTGTATNNVTGVTVNWS